MVPRSDHGHQTPLSVNIQDIPPEGLNLDCEVIPEWLDLPSDEGKVKGVFHWEGNLMKTTDGASVSGTLSGVIIRECVRCLQQYNDAISILCMAVFQNNLRDTGYIARADQKSTGGDSLEEDDEEIYPCDGNQVEFGRMLREQVILNSPIQPLCRPDCLGLCQNCGRDLNQGRCGCAERTSFSQQGTIRFRVRKARTN